MGYFKKKEVATGPWQDRAVGMYGCVWGGWELPPMLIYSGQIEPQSAISSPSPQNRAPVRNIEPQSAISSPSPQYRASVRNIDPQSRGAPKGGGAWGARERERERGGEEEKSCNFFPALFILCHWNFFSSFCQNYFIIMSHEISL